MPLFFTVLDMPMQKSKDKKVYWHLQKIFVCHTIFTAQSPWIIEGENTLPSPQTLEPTM